MNAYDVQGVSKRAMVMRRRSFRDTNDLESMRQLLAAGRLARNGSYYVHPGDLNWWLFYQPLDLDRREAITLWEEPDSKQLLGWGLFSPDWKAFDVFVQPELRGSQPAGNMYAWEIQKAAVLIAAKGGSKLRTIWISEGDTTVRGCLEKHGFHADGTQIYCLEQSLQRALPEVYLPVGYQVRQVTGEGEAKARAWAQHGTFGSALPFESYRMRYLGFMQSPIYPALFDLAVVAPDGSMASFCICWPDPISRSGLFEPVGTHPDYQKRGLGKAVILEGLRLLQAAGMQTALVCVEGDNLAAQRLYQAAGFQMTDRLLTYVKAV